MISTATHHDYTVLVSSILVYQVSSCMSGHKILFMRELTCMLKLWIILTLDHWGFLNVCMLGKQFKLEPVPEAAIAILIDYFREEIFTIGIHSP